MPELPEVETIRRDLDPLIRGRTFAGIKLYYKGFIKYPDPAAFSAGLCGKKVRGTGRRGKYLFFNLSREKCLVIHLRMTGRLIYYNSSNFPEKHTHGVFIFKEGGELHFHDVRKFAAMWLVDARDTSPVGGLKALGPEPLERDFNTIFLKEICRGSQGKIKGLLLSQRAAAGIGNIYSDEALFRAGIHPARAAKDLGKQEIENLRLAIKEVMLAGLAARGASMRDYVDARGREGRFQKYLQVYGRRGERCYKCGSAIEKTRICGRSSYFCPSCQK